MTPALFFPCSLLLLVTAGAAGIAIRRRYPALISEDHAGQFTAMQAAVLALLGLLVGFTFAMATNRFTERRQAELEEANAIRGAFLRTDTLPDAVRVVQRGLMRRYVEVRIEFYEAGDDDRRMLVALEHTTAAQTQLWKGIVQATGGRFDPAINAYLTSLTLTFDTAARRQAAFENRIPAMAWLLLAVVAGCSCFLVGLGVWRWNGLLLLVLPFVVASALTLIYDLDTPRSGVIRVRQSSMDRVWTLVNAGTSR